LHETGPLQGVFAGGGVAGHTVGGSTHPQSVTSDISETCQ
jgi:hypothetical protein